LPCDGLVPAAAESCVQTDMHGQDYFFETGTYDLGQKTWGGTTACAGGVLCLCWWCALPVLVVCSACAGGVLCLCWLRALPVLVACSACAGGVLCLCWLRTLPALAACSACAGGVLCLYSTCWHAGENLEMSFRLWMCGVSTLVCCPRNRLRNTTPS